MAKAQRGGHRGAAKNLRTLPEKGGDDEFEAFLQRGAIIRASKGEESQLPPVKMATIGEGLSKFKAWWREEQARKHPQEGVFRWLDELEERYYQNKELRRLAADGWAEHHARRRPLQPDKRAMTPAAAATVRRNLDVAYALYELSRAIAQMRKSMKAGEIVYDADDHRARRVADCDRELLRRLLAETALGLKVAAGRSIGTENTTAKGRQTREVVERLARELSNEFPRADKTLRHRLIREEIVSRTGYNLRTVRNYYPK